MRYIEHLIEPDRLLLSWQALESKNRNRYIVGELVHKDGKTSLHYFQDSQDFQKACEFGFTGYPAFQLKHGHEHHNNVLEAFVRRLPPRSRSDFQRYLVLRGLNPDAQISDFALLGYAGAKLPDDGFELVHPFDDAVAPFEFILEIAGFRYESVVEVANVTIDGSVGFIPEPGHQHDPRAIRIEQDGNKLGYVDRGRTGLLHSYLGTGHQVTGEVVRKNGTAERPLVYVYISITPAESATTAVAG